MKKEYRERKFQNNLGQLIFWNSRSSQKKNKITQTQNLIIFLRTSFSVEWISTVICSQYPIGPRYRFITHFFQTFRLDLSDNVYIFFNSISGKLGLKVCVESKGNLVTHPSKSIKWNKIINFSEENLYNLFERQTHPFSFNENSNLYSLMRKSQN